MVAISNVELMLLQIIYQQEEICGYEIDKLVKERDYREWADIGTTSIYTGLEKLRKKRFVRLRIDKEKRGKGPLPKKFRLKKKGKDVLKDELLKALSYTRERDKKFDLAFSAIGVLKTVEVKGALEKRKHFLLKMSHKLNEKLKSLGGERLPINIKALFKHSLYLIKNEVKFVDNLITDLKKEQTVQQRKNES